MSKVCKSQARGKVRGPTSSPACLRASGDLTAGSRQQGRPPAPASTSPAGAGGGDAGPGPPAAVGGGGGRSTWLLPCPSQDIAGQPCRAVSRRVVTNAWAAAGPRREEGAAGTQPCRPRPSARPPSRPQPPRRASRPLGPVRAASSFGLRTLDPGGGGSGGQDRAATGPLPGAAVRPGRARRAPGTGAQAGERLGQRPAGRAVPIRGLPARPRLSHCEWSFCFSELSFTYRPRELGTGVLLPAAPSPPSPVSVQPAPAGNLPTETYFCLRVLNDNDKQRRLAQELFV